MESAFIKDKSEFFAINQKTIFYNFHRLSPVRYVRAIPPKNTFVFSGDTKIALAIDQASNLLEEMSRSFEQRAKLWDEQSKHTAKAEGGNVFDKLFDRVRVVKTHITD